MTRGDPNFSSAANAVIRELEAELRRCNSIFAEQEQKIIELAERLTKEQARVAELLEAIRNHDEYCPDECEYIEGGRWLKEQAEAREREAEVE